MRASGHMSNSMDSVNFAPYQPPRRLAQRVYHRSSDQCSDVCVFITEVPITKLFIEGGGG